MRGDKVRTNGDFLDRTFGGPRFIQIDFRLLCCLMVLEFWRLLRWRPLFLAGSEEQKARYAQSNKFLTIIRRRT